MSSEEVDPHQQSPPPTQSRLVQILNPALEKIIKNASWRKHSKLTHHCKSLLDSLPSILLSSSSSSPLPSPTSSSLVRGPLSDGPLDLSLADSELLLSPLIDATLSQSIKIAEPSVDAIQKLISHGLLHGEADPSGPPVSHLLSKVIDAVCRCLSDISDDGLELAVLKTLLSAVTSTLLRIHGDCLLNIVRTCYDIYLDSKNVVNQTTAKASLVQMLVIVFRRMEADSSTVPVQPIVVAELMEPSEKDADDMDMSMTQFVQGFITKVMLDIDGVLNSGTPVRSLVGAHDGAFQTTFASNSTVDGTHAADLLDSTDKDMLDAKYWEISMYKTALEGRKGELVGVGVDDDSTEDVQIGNKLRRDAFLVFRALCKLSMKSPPKEAAADPHLMKGKVIALELLKILLENAGAVFRTSDR